MNYRFFHSTSSRQVGQAAVEYLVILTLVTLVLVVVAVEPAAITALLDAAKSFFKAFSFAISIPAQDAV